MIIAINELCIGKISSQSEELLKSLCHPVAKQQDTVTILGTNFDVSFMNHLELEKIPGNAFIFKSTDDGDKKVLKKCSASHLLALKIASKVIIT